MLGTHAGQRTFICNALSMGIPVDIVMKWTSHSDYSAMKLYIDIAQSEMEAVALPFRNLRPSILAPGCECVRGWLSLFP